MTDRPPDKKSPPPSPPRRGSDEKAWKQRKDAPARGKAAPPTKPPVKITALREGKQKGNS